MQAILGVDLLLTATPKLEKGNKRRSKKRDMFYVKLKEPRLNRWKSYFRVHPSTE